MRVQILKHTKYVHVSTQDVRGLTGEQKTFIADMFHYLPHGEWEVVANKSLFTCVNKKRRHHG